MTKNKEQQEIEIDEVLDHTESESESFSEPEDLMESEGLFAGVAEADEESDELLTSLESEQTEEVSVEGTELESFESVEIEEKEFIEDERLESILESILFATDKPVGLGLLKMVFKGTNIKTDKIKKTLDKLAVEYAGGRRGVTLEEVPGGWQLRTKVDNLDYLKRSVKTKTFKLSGPALEVLSIVAYKQPVIKSEIDQIRGVESGHLLRAIMEKNLVSFAGKSDLPGRPMLYETTRKFLEVFGLRNIKELPTLSQIDELLPEGMSLEEEKTQKPHLSEVTDAMAEQFTASSFSAGEEELMKIQTELEQISTSSEFFEKEKENQRLQKEKERAQNIRDAITVGEEVSQRDLNWLKKYDEALAGGTVSQSETTVEESPTDAKKPEAELGL